MTANLLVLFILPEILELAPHAFFALASSFRHGDVAHHAGSDQHRLKQEPTDICRI